MVKVESRGTLRLLTKRFMKMNRGRNLTMVLAVVLTSLLFTSLFMGCTSLILSRRQSEIENYMNSAHSTVENLTREEAEEIKKGLDKNNTVERYGSGMFLGSALDDRFGFSVEVRYGDENMAESFNCLPQTGAMPEKPDEIALSTQIMDALDIPYELGQEIRISWEADLEAGRMQTDTFRICGWWEGCKTAVAQIAWVSGAYAGRHAYPVSKEELSAGIYNGGCEYSVWFSSRTCMQNLWNFDKLSRNLSKGCGVAETERGFEGNPAYNMLGEDSFSIPSVAVLLVFIMLAGYLIIYNIFNISVKTDIRVYGLLKNAGTTGKQIKKCVRMQALRIAAAGIPAGLVLGYLCGLWMASSLNESSEISAQAGAAAETVISVHPSIFILSALFSLITVYLSSLHACRMAGSVSPAEALRLAENGGTQGRKKTKKHGSASWFGMAAGNFGRNWKRGVIVMISISLSLFVINCIVMLVKGYHFDVYKESYIAADFQLDGMREGGRLEDSVFQNVSQEVLSRLDACPSISAAGAVYFSSETHQIEPKLAEMLADSAGRDEVQQTEEEKAAWEKAQKEKEMKVHFFGIDQMIFDKLEWQGSPCTWEEFSTGDVVLAAADPFVLQEPPYEKGSGFCMEFKNGKSKQYQTAGCARLPYALDYPFYDYMYLTVFVPEDEYIAQTGNMAAMYAAADVIKGEEKTAGQYIDQMVQKETVRLNVSSVLNMQESFGRYIRKYYAAGFFLVAVLIFIGIANFFNTMTASVISRKKELALLEAVGMTKAQIVKMLAAESSIYLGGSFVLAVLLVLVLSKKLLSATFGNTFFFWPQLTIVPCAAMLPLLAACAYAVPKYLFGKISRESVVERIRHE